MMAHGLTKEELKRALNGPRKIADAFRILDHVSKSASGATCDDCTNVLGLTSNACSPRFSELVRAKCLVATGVRRQTRSGGLAQIYVAASNADFHWYLTQPKKRVTMTSREKAFASAAEAFLRDWKKQTKVEQKSRLISKLIQHLERIDKSNV